MALRQRAPDGNAAAITRARLEKIVKALGYATTARGVWELGVLGADTLSATFKTLPLVAGGENIGGEDVDVFDRPGEQGLDDALRQPRRAALARCVAGTGDLIGGAPPPRRETQTAARHMRAVKMQLDDDLKQVGDLIAGAAGPLTQAGEVRFDKGLIDPHHVADAQLLDNEIKKAARAIEIGAQHRWRQARARAGQIDIEPGVEELLKRPDEAGITDVAKVRGDVAMARIGAHHRWRKVPTRIAKARQLGA